MKANLKTALSAFAGMCLITVMFSGCSQAGTSRAPGQNTGRQLLNMQTRLRGSNLINATTQIREENLNGIVKGNNPGTNMGSGTIMGRLTNTTTLNRQKADAIKSQLMKLNGVDNANVIVVGNTALVGFKPTASTVNATVVRDRIINKVKAVDKTITNVTVSESPDIMNRMSRLSTDITSNKPVGTFMDEFNKLIQGVTPTTR